MIANLKNNQKRVLDVLTNARKPLTAYTILDRLRDQGFRAPLQVYRALDKLVAMQLVHRLDSLNAFIVCCNHQHDQEGIVAFTICDACKRVCELDNAIISPTIFNVAAELSFKFRQATIEVRGLCRQCIAEA